MLRIEYDKLSKIKQIDLPQLLQSKGIQLKHNGNGSYTGLCPFHDDHNPSLSISFKHNKWLWHCFACNKSGTIIEFLKLLENKPFTDVYRQLSQLIPAQDVNMLNDIVKLYHNNLAQSRPAQDYLIKRGLYDKGLIETFKLGYSNGALLKLLPEDEATKHKLQALGILNENYNESYYKSITVPIFDENDNVVGLYGRNIETKRHGYLKSPHRGVFNCKAARVYDSLLITEAIIDALTLYKEGFKNVIASYGNNGFTDAHLNLLRKSNTKEVTLAYDNDTSSNEAALKLARLLTSHGIKVLRLRLPEGIKDINQYFSYNEKLNFKGTADTFTCLLDSAKQIGYFLKRPSQEELPAASGTNNFSFLYEQIEYNTRLVDAGDAASLKTVITAVSGEKRHTDKFDLYSQKSRRRFANTASGNFNTPAAKIEQDLLDIITRLELRKEKLFTSETAPDKPAYVMTATEKQTALTHLKNPHLIENITKDLTSCGYIGECSNKLIAYLVATSRKLRKPLSAIIVSQSATGKSYLMETVASLMPDEDVEFYSRITPQSLYYMERDQLKHKLLIIDERSGSEEADYAIRSLQTRHKLTLAYPLKDPADGRLRTIVVEMEGPIAFMESSTKSKLNIENTTRSFMLYLDDSETQTKQIHAHQRYLRTLEGKRRLKDIPRIIGLHKNIQRLLRPVNIIIDFSNLSFPSTWIRTRRDQERFLCLIEAVTYLHQYQRTIKKDPTTDTEYIKATQHDYQIAYNLSKTALLDNLNDLPKPARAFLTLLEDAVSDKAITSGQQTQEFTFRRRNVREWLKLPDHVVKRHMRLLEELEYVAAKRDSKNGYITYTLQIEKAQSTYLDALTSPEVLKTGTQLVQKPCSTLNSNKQAVLA